MTLRSGAPGADDSWNGQTMDTQGMNPLSLLINSSGGITGAGLGKGLSSDGINRKGSTVTIDAAGRVELLGTLNAGGRLVQTFAPNGGPLLNQSVAWSGRDSDLIIRSTGRVFVGGLTWTGSTTAETGGFFNASRLIDVQGGSDSVSGKGLIVQASSELVVQGTRNNDNSVRAAGEIRLRGVNDVDMQGLLLAGGRSTMVRDNAGRYLGRSIERYDVDSQITVQADRQLIIGTDITAGKSVTLRGGLDSRTPTVGAPYEGRGLVLYGTASIATSRANGTINLDAPGRIDLLAPLDVNELTFKGRSRATASSAATSP